MDIDKKKKHLEAQKRYLKKQKNGEKIYVILNSLNNEIMMAFKSKLSAEYFAKRDDKLIIKQVILRTKIPEEFSGIEETQEEIEEIYDNNAEEVIIEEQNVKIEEDESDIEEEEEEEDVPLTIKTVYYE